MSEEVKSTTVEALDEEYLLSKDGMSFAPPGLSDASALSAILPTPEEAEERLKAASKGSDTVKGKKKTSYVEPHSASSLGKTPPQEKVEKDMSMASVVKELHLVKAETAALRTSVADLSNAIKALTVSVNATNEAVHVSESKRAEGINQIFVEIKRFERGIEAKLSKAMSSAKSTISSSVPETVGTGQLPHTKEKSVLLPEVEASDLSTRALEDIFEGEKSLPQVQPAATSSRNIATEQRQVRSYEVEEDSGDFL